jgi:toxin ParE1/3/4
MAALIWTEPTLQDMDAIADYIAIDNPVAAGELVRRVFRHIEQLQAHPESGSLPPELREFSRR